MAITKDYNENMDFTTEYGFAIVLLLLLRVKPGGLLFAGIQCSSWVWMSRATSQRTPENIWGNEATKGVRNGNILNRHMAILGKVASRIGVTWLVEQPSSSKFFSTPDMLSCMETCDAKRVHFNMSAFGHVMPKPTVLVGTASWIHEIHDPQRGASSSDAHVAVLPLKKRPAAAKSKARAAKLVKKLTVLSHSVQHHAYTVKTDADGKKRVTGKKGTLKESQVYPVKFALMVVRKHWKV
jgi:hypothetical protein